MMGNRPSRGRSRSRGWFALGASALILALASPAWADVTDPLDDAASGIDVTVSPTPSLLDEITGTLNDTVGDLSDDLAPGGDGGSEPGATGGSGGGGTSGSTRSPSGASGGVRDPAGAVRAGTRGRSGDGSLSAGTSDAVGAAENSHPSYRTLAANGTLAALERAVHMAAPFAPPLFLAGLALALAGVASRGSKRLVKVEEAAFAQRTYRL